MSLKKSVSLTSHTVAAIESRYSADEVNWSGAITMFRDRYCAMIRASLAEVDLTTQEWTTLFSIYAGTMTDHDAEGVAKMLLAEVLDSEQYEMGDAPHLPEKIRSMNFCQRMAVVDMIDRFWAGQWDGFEDYEQIVAHLMSMQP